MEIEKLEEILKDQPAYRLLQAKTAIFKDLLDDWSQALFLPKELRVKLSSFCPLEIKGEVTDSLDKESAKALMTLKDGLKIETVLMKHRDGRKTICVSSQVGCPLGCLFCATGKMGFKRNLTLSEIVSQVIFFARLLKDSAEKVTNLVFMGMGEPFLNSENVLNTIKVLNDKDGFNLGMRHISISTVGITEGIEKLACENWQVNLAVSLHAPNNELRSKLIPVNEKYPLEKIFAAVNSYLLKTHRRVMFEYLLIDGVNDTDENALQLSGLMKKPLYFVNLIPYNQTGYFKASSPEKVKRFKEILESNGVAVTQRYRFGEEIEAACGQLAAKETKLQPNCS